MTKVARCKIGTRGERQTECETEMDTVGVSGSGNEVRQGNSEMGAINCVGPLPDCLD